VIGQAISLLALPAIPLLFKPADLGIAQTFGAALGVLGIISCAKLDQAIIVAVPSQVVSIFAAGCAVSLALSLTILAIVVASISLGMITSQGQWVFLLLAPAVIIVAFYQLINAVALKRQSFTGIAKTKIEQAAVGLGGVLAAGAAGMGALGLALAQLLQQLCGASRLMQRVAPELTISNVSRHKREIIGVYRVNTHLLLHGTGAALVNNLAWSAPIFAIAHFYGSETAGYFAFAWKCVSPVNILATSTLSQLSLGEGAQCVAASDHKGLRRQVHGFLKASCVGAICVIILGWLGRAFLSKYLTGNWHNSSDYVLPLAVLAAMQLALNPLASVAVLYRQQAAQLKYDIIRAILVAAVFASPSWIVVSTVTVMWIYVGAMFAMYCVYARFFLRMLEAPI
jgi:O-antigen/teichoic acid export membrane protein